MKKVILTAFSLLLTLGLFAQDAPIQAEESAKSGDVSYLPEAGDFSIGFTIDPIATFVGNMFNGNTSNKLKPLHGEGLNNPCASIMGKYLLQDNFAIKANIGFIISSVNEQYYVSDDAALMLDPLSKAKVLDSKVSNSYGGSISFGAEYRLGKRKVQGIFGGGLLYSFQTSNTTYSYGNGITEINQRPTSEFAYSAYSTAIPNSRVLSDFSTKGTHTVGLYGNIGVEWFVAPKISLGADVNLCLLYTITPDCYKTVEGYNVFTQEIEKTTQLESPMNSAFEFGIRNIGANLFINFYF